MSFFGKLGFTRREKITICTLCLAILAGSFVRNHRKDLYSSGSDVLAHEDSLKIQILGTITGENANKDNPNPLKISEKQEIINPFPVNINDATAEELMILPGIGQVLAENIVEYRNRHGEFTVIDSILKVPGIGKKRLELIKDKITLSKTISEE